MDQTLANKSTLDDSIRQVLSVSRMLVVTTELQTLLTRIAEAAASLLHCERASIFLHDPATDQLWTRVAMGSSEIRVPSSAGIVGASFTQNSVVLVADPYADSRFNPAPDRATGFVTRNLLAAPMLDMSGKPVGVIQAVNRIAGGFESRDETLIQLLADQAGVAIQRYNLQQQAVHAGEMRREMELAKAVQAALLPSAAPELPNIDAAGWTQPASMTGGDCYDLWLTGDGRLGIFVGDATGHGIGPAMVVSQVRTLVRAMCDVNADPRTLLTCANARMCEDLDAGSFVTAFVAFLASDGTLDWCSAGHAPILIRQGGDDPVLLLDANAPPLGIVPELRPDEVPGTRLGPGGFLCVVSDGILEAFSGTGSGEQFDAHRLLELLTAYPRRSATDVIDLVRSSVRSWQGGDEPRDDQTMVLARIA